MALLKNAELWYPRLIPGRPNKKFSRENPTWEIQIRTSNPEVRKSWEAQGVKLKAIVPDDGSPPYWKTTLKKKIYKRDGTDNDPVEVKGGNLRDIDPATIGNGSKGHVRIFQYEYPKAEGAGTGIASVLMGVQLTSLKKRTPKPREDDFVEEDMDIIEEEDEDEDEGGEEAAYDEDDEDAAASDEGGDVPEPPKKPAPKKPPTAPKKKFD